MRSATLYWLISSHPPRGRLPSHRLRLLPPSPRARRSRPGVRAGRAQTRNVGAFHIGAVSVASSGKVGVALGVRRRREEGPLVPGDLLEHDAFDVVAGADADVAQEFARVLGVDLEPAEVAL